MSLIAFVTDQMTIGKILEHLGLSSPQAAKSPSLAREVFRVAEYADCWGTPQQSVDAARPGCAHEDTRPSPPSPGSSRRLLPTTAGPWSPPRAR